MASGIFSVGVSALNAAQIGLQTTNHNIANASTPGYNRQQIVQSTNTPMFTGAGFIGQGTNVLTVRRIYDQYLSAQVLSAKTGAAEMDSYYAQISQIDNILADPDAGLSPALAAFFKGVQDVAANPASVSSRQAMISGAQALVARFHSIDQRLTEIRDGVNGQVTSELSAINSYAQQIAEINQRIILAQAAGASQPANDLLDQREQMVAELNQKIRVQTVIQSDGSYNVFIGNGQPLVVGTINFPISAATAPDDPQKVMAVLQAPGGSITYLQESLLTGGSLGGLIAFRNQSLDAAQNALGRIAITLAQNFNDQHRLGMDLTGALGTNFFNVASPIVYPNSNNTGTGAPAVSISSVGQLTTSDYRLDFVGGNYRLTRLADAVVVSTSATLPITIDGLTIATGTWTPAANDSFLIQPTRAGANSVTGINVAIVDPRNIAAAAPMRTSASLANTGTGQVSAGTVNPPPPPNANLTQPVTITFNNPPTTFNVTGVGTGNPTNVPFTAGANISYNGWTIQISGVPGAGDVFSVGANSNGISDNRNAVLLGALQTQNTMVGGTATYQSAYAQLVSQVGNKTREVQTIGEAQQKLAEQAEAARSRVSGVNLDEEAANLLRYQQAYQAAAKTLDVAGKLFEEVLALGR